MPVGLLNNSNNNNNNNKQTFRNAKLTEDCHKGARGNETEAVRNRAV